MSNTLERQNDILKLVENLDIPPSMYKNADDKYHAVASFLETCGIEADMYPQGSFALGTVVRPTVKDPDAAYDLDFICQVRQTKDKIAPSELRRKIQNALESSDVYASRLKVWDECFTIEYADINGIGFTIDIVPAADETVLSKQKLKGESHRPDLLDTAIAIPRHNGNRNYDWITNNPRGFRVWFEEVNQPFMAFNRDERRRAIFKASGKVYASIDDIPEGLERSAMQRVIQILKYHRDVYYYNLRRDDSDDLKPISAIINTLVAEISKTAHPEMGIFELLQYVLNELNIYAERQTLSGEEFAQKYGSRSVISKSKDSCRWVIQNPADPEDNLADKWNDNADIPKYFFRWIAMCSKDLIQSMSTLDSEFRTTMENAFGASAVQRGWGDKYKPAKTPDPRPITNSPKPYQK